MELQTIKQLLDSHSNLSCTPEFDEVEDVVWFVQAFSDVDDTDVLGSMNSTNPPDKAEKNEMINTAHQSVLYIQTDNLNIVAQRALEEQQDHLSCNGDSFLPSRTTTHTPSMWELENINKHAIALENTQTNNAISNVSVTDVHHKQCPRIIKRLNNSECIMLKKKNQCLSASQQNLLNIEHNAGLWSNEEHERFLSGLKNEGRNWKKIAPYVKTRSVGQVRSHAQKYFKKLG